MSAAVNMRKFRGLPCPYCGDPMGTRGNRPNAPTRDHVVPYSVDTESDIIVVCRACNEDKGPRTLEQWFAHLVATLDARRFVVGPLLRKQGQPDRTDASGLSTEA